MKNKIQRIILYQWFSTGVPRDRLCVPRKISNICNYAGKNIENSTLFHYICVKCAVNKKRLRTTVLYFYMNNLGIFSFKFYSILMIYKLSIIVYINNISQYYRTQITSKCLLILR